MAVKNLRLLCLFSLGFCALSLQERNLCVELSCGAGPVHLVLEPGWPLLLECRLGASPIGQEVEDEDDQEWVEIHWLRDGQPLIESPGLSLLSNGSLLLEPTLPLTRDNKVPTAVVESSYSCQSTDAFGTLISRVITLSLASLSHVLSDPKPQVIPEGGAARFQCQVEGQPIPTITWEKDKKPLEPNARFISLPSGVLQILAVTEGDAGSYRCAASSIARKSYSQESPLTVIAGQPLLPSKVEFVARPQNSTVVFGQPAVMECMAQGHPKPLVSWSRQDGKPIATDVVVLETNLLIPHTHGHHAGIYVCRANKPMTREFVSTPAELRVLSPPVILQPPESMSLSRGNTARFVCNSSGDPVPTLRWLQNGRAVRLSGRVKLPVPGVLLINQLAPSDAGYYQCQATNSLGVACAVARLSVIVREGLPSAPRQLQATPISSTTALLTWERPEINSDQIIAFSVHYQEASGQNSNEFQKAVNNDTTEFQLRGLQPHTPYSLYVVAYAHHGASRPSQPIIMETLEDVPDASPQLSLMSPSPTEIRVIWHPLTPKQSRGFVTHYRIDYSTLGQEVRGNETQVTLQGLSANQIYRVRMTAATSQGFGPTSDWHVHQTPSTDNPSMVLTELRVRAKMHSLHVSWQLPPNPTQVSGFKLAYQMLEGTIRNGTENQPIKLRRKVKHYNITDLVPGSWYQVQVWAYNKHTEGHRAVWKGRTDFPPSPTVVPQDPPPLPPTSIRAMANSSRSIWLHWERPRFSSVRIINYTVRCSPAGLRNASLVAYYISTTQDILLGALRPFTRYEMAIQSNGEKVGGPFSSTVEESTFADRPSSAPADMQLSALNSSTVLVKWLPPLEPNGIIISYSILFSYDIEQPDYLWTNTTHNGSVSSVEVQGLLSGTRYFFKMGACTEVGAGPFSAVKDIHTLSEFAELDIDAVTGIIVGVCLGLLFILFCMFVSFRHSKTAEMVEGGASNSPSPAIRHGAGRALPPSPPDGSDRLELESLVPPMVPHSGPNGTREPLPERLCLMGPANTAVDTSLSTEIKLAWNGSVSSNSANRISRHQDTIIENCPMLRNGVADHKYKEVVDDTQLYSPVCSHKVEAEVIVHSELSDLSSGAGAKTSLPGSPGSQSLPSSDVEALPSISYTLSSITPSIINPNALQEATAPSAMANMTLQQGLLLSGELPIALTNGFHSPKLPNLSAVKVVSIATGQEGSGSPSRLCNPTQGLGFAKATTGNPASPSLAGSGLTLTTSGEYTLMCP